MKKIYARLLGLFIAVCISCNYITLSASAIDICDSDFVIVNANTSMCQVAMLDEDSTTVSDNATPYILETNGVYSGVKRIIIYPAVCFSDGTIGYDASINNSLERAEANSPFGVKRLTPTETQAILSDFKTKTGYEANCWYFVATYNIYTDGKGSYGKYFSFKPTSTYLGSLNDDGTITC